MTEELKLNEKQLAFVKEYIIDFNGTQAAIRAGYSEKTANVQSSQLLAKLNVSNAIKAEIEKRNQRVELTQEKVLEDIEFIKKKAMKPAYDAQGNEIMSHFPTALKAAELQAKHLGMFVDKSEVKHTGGVDVLSINPKELTEEQLRAIASIKING